MEHSKKYALIPVDRMQQFEEEHSSELDLKIQNILKKKIEEDEKAKLYIQALQKYVIFPNVNNIKLPTEQQHEQIPKNNMDIENEILESVPVRHKIVAEKILEFLKKHQVSWTHNKEALIENKIIPGSNIIQLVNFLLRNRSRRPVAFEEFKEFLTLNSFPAGFIKNNYLTDIKTIYAKPKSKNKQISLLTKWKKM